MGERGQAWSMDLVIGVLIFMLAIGIIYTLLVSKGKEDTAPLRIESEVIATKLTTIDAANPQLAVAKNNRLDIAQLGNLTSEKYTDLQQQFGVKHEFCIYLQDENGNIVYITNSSGAKFAGIGSGIGDLNLTAGNNPCGCPVNCYPQRRPECNNGTLPVCT